MPDKIRWGLLSTARINDALIAPIRAAERSELAAVASRDPERARAYARDKGIPQAYGSYEELVADPQIDVIYNPLPNSLHCEWTVRAAAAGKHVLCEKPITISLPELNQVEAAATASGVTVFEAFMYLHHPQTLRVRELIAEGTIGQVQLVNSWFNFYLPPERAENIRLRADVSGGSLWDVGVYPNSMAVTMVGDGAPVSVTAHQIVGESGVDVAMRAQLHFSGGAVAQISSGFRTPFREAAFVVGDAGIVEIVEPWKPGVAGKESHVFVTGRDGRKETLTFAPVNPYLCEVQAMEACVLDGAAPVVPLARSRDFLRSVLAAYESARTGQIVRL